MDHLLNQCSYNSQVWDLTTQIMATTDRQRDNTATTTREWRKATFNNPILNHIWQLLSSFILWQLWKERNRIIFQSIRMSWDHIWHKIWDYILETVCTSKWSEEDFKCDKREQPILQKWNFSPIDSSLSLTSRVATTSSPLSWKKPPPRFVKVNFDGASKGNPGLAGYGVVFIND
jgi:hypothetical protein